MYGSSFSWGPMAQYGIDSYNAQTARQGQDNQFNLGMYGAQTQRQQGANDTATQRQANQLNFDATKYMADKNYGAAMGQAQYGGQAQKDMAAFGALQGLGTTGLNAMGQYGSNRDNALANQSIAAANAYGSMANSYYNTMGQLGNYATGLSAAGLNAGAQSANANMNGSFNMDTGGGFNFGGGMFGGNGFRAAGPEGTISSGRYGGGRGGNGFGADYSNSGSGSNAFTLQKGSAPAERAAILKQGYGFLGDVGKSLNNPNNQAMMLGGLMGREFGNNRAAIMDPSIVNSMNNQLGAGYSALGGLYGMSDYGFNTVKPPADHQPSTPPRQSAPWTPPGAGFTAIPRPIQSQRGGGGTQLFSAYGQQPAKQAAPWNPGAPANNPTYTQFAQVKSQPDYWKNPSFGQPAGWR